MPLIAALDDVAGTVRGQAIEALSKLGDKRAVEPLYALLHKTADTYTHQRVTWALDQLATV